MMPVINQYCKDLQSVIAKANWQPLQELGECLLKAIRDKRQVFICGNGGSAGNAIHLANDFLYGVEPSGRAMRVEALSANSAVLTCLGNDLGYEQIFAQQLKVKAVPGDILIVLSGSGNSENIVQALKVAKEYEMKSFAILGYSGGKAKSLADSAIHFAIDDMQIAEDLQLITGHMLMKYLKGELKA
ncbi:MAG: SIS domain-containing protein [Aestuariibacter sp.]